MEPRIIEKLDKFFSQYRQQKYRKGEILVRAGDSPSGVFYLKNGRVREYAISGKGEEIVVNIFKPLSFFPMSWAINNTSNIYFFEAMEDLELIRAPRDEVLEFVKSEPEILYNLLSRVYIGTDGLLSRMTYLMSGSAYERLIAELIIIAKRFGEKRNGQITIQTSERDLASQMGMTRETVSREIKKLKARGLASFSKKHLIIKDIGKLEEELSAGD